MKFEKKDVIFMWFTAIVFVAYLISSTISELKPKQPIVYEVKPEITIHEQFMRDIKKLPDPVGSYEPKEEVEFWRNTDPFQANELIPLSEADQISLHHICKVNHVPMSFALAIIDTESNFDENAVGNCGEVGLFQINPVNWERMAEKDIDVHCTTGNMEAGVLMLREALDTYMEMDKATMVFKCGAGRAKELIDADIKLEVCDEVSSLAMYYEELLNGEN